MNVAQRVVIVIGLLVIGGTCESARVLGAKPADVKPRIVTRKDARPELVLPDSLKAAMRKYNSKMQLRTWDDYAPETLESFMHWEPNRVPWAIWGDFDGNGRTDVAFDLRDAKATMSKLVAYHQDRYGAWQAHLLCQGSGEVEDPFCLYLCPRGQKGSRPHDVIWYAAPESDHIYEYYWKGGKYHEVPPAQMG